MHHETNTLSVNCRTNPSSWENDRRMEGCVIVTRVILALSRTSLSEM
ncbi:hypothetical protein ABZ471_45070 [Streptomyces sp. NPDC005728]